MGIRSLRGTEAYNYLLTSIPLSSEIKTLKLYDTYEMKTVNNSRRLLGLLCDYGVRSYFPMRGYAYTEIRNALHDVDSVVDSLILQFRLSALESYMLLSGSKDVYLAKEIQEDYGVLVDRAISLYNCLNKSNPVYGKMLTVGGCVRRYECDFIDDNMVIDMKITTKVTEKYWAQVLAYSLLSKYSEYIPRKVIGLMLPVQGEFRYYQYPSGQYSGVYKRFIELYKEV